MQFYTLEEFNIFIGEVTDPIYKSFYTLLFFMGLGQGEAQALTWRDINIKDKILSVNKTLTSKIKGEKYKISPPKTKSSNRVLPIPDIVVTELSNLLLFYKDKPNFDENCFVFGMENPLPENTIRIKKVFAANKAKIKQIRIHDFRHSCASLLISEGAIITVVAKYLGHSDIKQTLNTYAHMYPSNLYKVVEAVNKLCLKSEILVPN